MWGSHFSNKEVIEVIKITSSNQRSSNPLILDIFARILAILEVFWKKGVLENSCSEIKNKVPGDHSHNTIFSLMFTNIDITCSTQGCLKQA